MKRQDLRMKRCNAEEMHSQKTCWRVFIDKMMSERNYLSVQLNATVAADKDQRNLVTNDIE